MLRKNWALAWLTLSFFIGGTAAMTIATYPTTTPKTGATRLTEQVNWSYKDKQTGVDVWDRLHSDFFLCGKGKEQSPIDIDLSKVTSDESLEEIPTDYRPTRFAVVNNGHTIQAIDHTGKNQIVVEGETSALRQLHFHAPSEHTLNGKHFDLEAHLVHENKDGRLAVIGIFLVVGEENDDLAELFEKMPTEKTNQTVKLADPIQLLNILPKEETTLRYNGSLTTPPCTEGVSWILFEHPITISKKQLNAYLNIFNEPTNRPTQPLRGRIVYTN